MNMSTHRIYIGIGTNQKEADRVLARTRQKLLKALGDKALFSTPVQTEPIDFPTPALFTNQLAVFETTVPEEEIHIILKRIERQTGRRTGDKARGVVKLDLDLLRIDDEVVRPTDWERSYIQQAVMEIMRIHSVPGSSSTPTVSTISSPLSSSKADRQGSKPAGISKYSDSE